MEEIRKIYIPEQVLEININDLDLFDILTNRFKLLNALENFKESFEKVEKLYPTSENPVRLYDVIRKIKSKTRFYNSWKWYCNDNKINVNPTLTAFILKYNKLELMKLRNMGKKTIDELSNAISEYNLELK